MHTVNITIERHALDMIDAAAKRNGVSRSKYMTDCALSAIVQFGATKKEKAQAAKAMLAKRQRGRPKVSQ